jgi:hypothetical protein
MVRQRTLAQIERARHNALPEGQKGAQGETASHEAAPADGDLVAPSI